MGFQVTWYWEALVAVCALEWLLSHVSPLIFLQVGSYWETLVTLWAVKRLLFCVGPFMLLQGTWSWKTFVTLFALECLFSSVSPSNLMVSHFVHLNGISPVWVPICSFKWPAIEKLLAHRALKKLLFYVGPLMFLQVACLRECLILQLKHLNSVSSMWVLSRFFKLHAWEKLKHLNSVSSMRVLSWVKVV